MSLTLSLSLSLLTIPPSPPARRDNGDLHHQHYATAMQDQRALQQHMQMSQMGAGMGAMSSPGMSAAMYDPRGQYGSNQFIMSQSQGGMQGASMATGGLVSMGAAGGMGSMGPAGGMGGGLGAGMGAMAGVRTFSPQRDAYGESGILDRLRPAAGSNTMAQPFSPAHFSPQQSLGGSPAHVGSSPLAVPPGLHLRVGRDSSLDADLSALRQGWEPDVGETVLSSGSSSNSGLGLEAGVDSLNLGAGMASIWGDSGGVPPPPPRGYGSPPGRSLRGIWGNQLGSQLGQMQTSPQARFRPNAGSPRSSAGVGGVAGMQVSPAPNLLSLFALQSASNDEERKDVDSHF